MSALAARSMCVCQVSMVWFVQLHIMWRLQNLHIYHGSQDFWGLSNGHGPKCAWAVGQTLVAVEDRRNLGMTDS